MTKEQMIQLLDTELDAMNKHRSNIERIKKEYFDSVYGFKKGDKVNVLYKRSKAPLVGFFKSVQIMNTGTVIFTIQEVNKEGRPGRGSYLVYEGDLSEIKKPEWYELYEEMYDTFVWITDTCLQDGKIRKVKAKIEDYDGTLLADTPNRFTPYTIGYQAFKNKEEALKYVEEQRTDLIKHLKLQIHELENLKFKCDD